MRIVLIVIIAAGIIAVALVAMFASALPTKDYDLSVDALKDEQSLFTNARVVVKNTGMLASYKRACRLWKRNGASNRQTASRATRERFLHLKMYSFDQVTVTADPEHRGSTVL